MHGGMPSRTGRWISLQRADWCEGCGAPLANGSRARWDPIARSVTCAACAGPFRSDPPLVLELGPAPPPPPRPSPVAPGPADRRAARSAGRVARLAGLLDRELDGLGIRLLHDRAVPGARTAADHVAVGPGGVTAISVCRLPGEVRLIRRGRPFGRRTEHLEVGGRDRSELLEAVEEQVAALEALLRASGQAGVDVAGALCMAAPEGLPLFGRMRSRGVLIAGSRGVAKLAARPGALAAPGVEAVLLTLAARLDDGGVAPDMG
jgi:hypothetical protein